MAYLCYNCRKSFTYPKEIVTTYEEYIGVSHIFPTKTPMRELVCPYCRSEEIHRRRKEYEDE